MTEPNIWEEIRNLRNWVIVDIIFTAALAGEKAIEILLTLVA